MLKVERMIITLSASSSSSLTRFLPLRKVMSSINRVFFTASHWPPARINIRLGLEQWLFLISSSWLDDFLLLFYRIAPWVKNIGDIPPPCWNFSSELIRSLTPGLRDCDFSCALFFFCSYARNLRVPILFCHFLILITYFRSKCSERQPYTRCRQQKRIWNSRTTQGSGPTMLSGRR